MTRVAFVCPQRRHAPASPLLLPPCVSADRLPRRGGRRDVHRHLFKKSSDNPELSVTTPLVVEIILVLVEIARRLCYHLLGFEVGSETLHLAPSAGLKPVRASGTADDKKSRPHLSRGFYERAHVPHVHRARVGEILRPRALGSIRDSL